MNIVNVFITDTPNIQGHSECHGGKNAGGICQNFCVHFTVTILFICPSAGTFLNPLHTIDLIFIQYQLMYKNYADASYAFTPPHCLKFRYCNFKVTVAKSLASFSVQTKPTKESNLQSIFHCLGPTKNQFTLQSFCRSIRSTKGSVLRPLPGSYQSKSKILFPVLRRYWRSTRGLQPFVTVGTTLFSIPRFF